jgi:hypothetical protein
MSATIPFTPTAASGGTFSPGAAVSSTNIPASGNGNAVCLITNTGANLMHARVRSSTDAAASGVADMVAIGPGQRFYFSKPINATAAIDHISATGTTAHFVCGEGGI